MWKALASRVAVPIAIEGPEGLWKRLAIVSYVEHEDRGILHDRCTRLKDQYAAGDETAET